MTRKIRRLGRKSKSFRSSKGKFILQYQSYPLNHEIKFVSEFKGISNADLDELKFPGKIQMSRNAWLAHQNLPNHFSSEELFLEVLNDPDLILLQEKLFRGNKVSYILKGISTERPRIVIIFTNSNGVHNIASGYYITSTNVAKYQRKYKVVYDKKLSKI